MNMKTLSGKVEVMGKRVMVLIIFTVLCWVVSGASMMGGWASASMEKSNPTRATGADEGPIPALAAYYTKIDSGEDFERHSRTGEYADIVVSLTDGRFVFWRGASYLPYWETSRGRWYVDEVVPRSGDGNERMPDKVNMYSHVRIIENSPKRVVVHWRYLPQFTSGNPKTNEDHTKFVDEYFTIAPDGNVIRTIRRGTERYDDWVDPLKVKTQTFKLTSDGIGDVKAVNPDSSGAPEPVDGNPVKTGVVRSPIAWWKFDEGAGGTTVESVSGQKCTISGHKSHWKNGISGAALQFDGYTSMVSMPEAPSPTGNLTIEAWIAIGARPWELVPIIQRGGVSDGYFVGVDNTQYAGNEARFTFKVHDGTKWTGIVCNIEIEVFRWMHIAGTFDRDTGVVYLYIDGKRVDGEDTEDESAVMPEGIIQIGKGEDQVYDMGLLSSFGFDGLIDEIRIYDAVLSEEEVKQAYSYLKPADAISDNPDMQRRVFPTGITTGRFGARYTRLQYYETWDSLFRFGDHADVVVEFDETPVKFIFWRGPAYTPMIVSPDGYWYTNEFNEDWHREETQGRGCAEPMSDKQCHYGHVRILENTPARVVIYWRYPQVTVDHWQPNYNDSTGWGDWSDWYYYIYPDGVACKKMINWSTNWIPDETREEPFPREYQETKVVFSPGQSPDEVIEPYETLTLATRDGWSRSYDWADGPPRRFGSVPDVEIQIVNLVGIYDAFTIEDVFEWFVYSGGDVGYSQYPLCNHWPCAQIKSDGSFCWHNDRAHATGLSQLPPEVYDSGDIWQERIMLEGMSSQSLAELRTLASSWMSALTVSDTRSCTSQGYDRSQRAYILTAHDSAMSFRINASKNSPVVNPCFVVEKWESDASASLEIDGEIQKSGPSFRQGTIRDTDGTRTLIIWVKYGSISTTDFTLSRSSL